MLTKIKKGDLVKCNCSGCGTKLTVITDGVHPGKCSECSQGNPHRHDARGLYVSLPAKLPWENKDRETFAGQE